MKEFTSRSETFFAAANGFSGFRSNFDLIFTVQKLDKLFVIKGGPGTGKSTLMKRISKELEHKAKITNILCSSDPSSLDGVIISKNGISVGIVDGTAPHTIEPMYPGAFEEIINLGDGFDFEGLRQNRSEIIDLTHSKKMQYKRAYYTLHLAGEVFNYIFDLISENEIYNTAEYLLKNMISKENASTSLLQNQHYLIGAFCKDGYKRLTTNTDEKYVVRIKGDGILEYFVLTEIKNILQTKGLLSRQYHSAFSPNLYDALGTDDYAYVISDTDSYDVDLSQITKVTSEYTRNKNIYDQLIEESRMYFESAASYHFRLEEIYSKNISFEKNERLYDLIIDKINVVFNK